MTTSAAGSPLLVIGLLGKIGAGKSTVARRFAEHGAHVIDADSMAHEVLAEPAVVQAIAARFGSGVLSPEGRVLRPALAEAVFGPSAGHAAALEALEAIVHPRVHERIEAQLAGWQAAASRLREGIAAVDEAETGPGAGFPRPGRKPLVVVLDVPLLGTGGWADRCDSIVVLDCPDHVREQRLAQRQLSPRQRAAREAAWQAAAPPHPPAEKTLRVDTSGDVAYTRAQVDRIWSHLGRSALLP
jgi:dephospho-CoA kinase